MNIKRTIITTVVALALVAMIAPGVAQGVTIEELLAQISQLQAQLNLLMGQQGGTPVPTGTAACAGVTFTRALVVGSTGTDVKCLQILLNNNGYTLAQTGAGSPGAETSYFGPITLAAVRAFQVGHGWTPANQVGPLTRAALNALIGTTVTPGVLPPGCTTNSGFSPTTGQSCGTGTGPVIIPTGAGLTVQLAYDNPASSTLVSGTTTAQGGADLAHITFVNGDNAEVSVTSLKLNRIGISADATFANLYLYEGQNRLTDGATVSSGVITFNDPSGLFKVPAGGSKTIRVLVDLATSASGQTMGVNISSADSITTNASSVNGMFPVSGNLFTAASGTLAGVSFHTTTTPSSDANVDPQNDTVMWQNLTTVSTRAVTLKRFALRQTGSALSADIQNFRLYVDGIQVGSAVSQIDANGYVTFDLSASPVKIETGARYIKVLADIIGGSSKTFIFSLRNTTDAAFTDTQYGVDIIPQANSTTFTQRITATQTIQSGTLSFVKASDSPAGEVVLGAPASTLAKYTLTAAGEPVKVTDLYVGIVDSTTAGVTYFANGALFANGVQIGSTTNIAEGDITTGTQFSLGSSLIVNPGSPVTLEIRADIKETSGTTAVADGDSIYAAIMDGSSNAEGTVSKTTISTPAANVNGNTLTVSIGGLTLSKYTAQPNTSLVAPASAYKLGSFTLTANTTEAVNLTQIDVILNNSASQHVLNLYVTYGTSTTTPKPTVSTSSTTNSWYINTVLPVGTSIPIDVYGDIADAIDDATYAPFVEMTVNGTTVSSGQEANSSTAVDGQTLLITTSTLTPDLDGSSPVAKIIAGGQAVDAGIYSFTAQNEDYTLNELRFTIPNTNNDGTATAAYNSIAIVNASLLDSTTGAVLAGPIAYNSASSYFNFTGLNIVVPSGTAKKLTLSFYLSPYLTSDASSTQVDVAPTLSYVKAYNSQGVPKNSTTHPTIVAIDTAAANALWAFKSVPTITHTGTNKTISSAAQDVELYKFTVAADAKGPIDVKQFVFTTTMTDMNAATNTLDYFKFYKGGSNYTDQVTIRNSLGESIEGTSTVGTGYVIVTFGSAGAGEDTIAAGATQEYTLKARATNFSYISTVGTDSVSVSLDEDTSAETSATGYGGSYIHVGTVVLAGIYDCVTGRTTAAAASFTGVPNFIWSDHTANYPYIHSATSNTSSSDWHNGYKVLGLPLPTQSVNGQ